MDHLAPSSGVNWYTSYNGLGELLAAAPQLPPIGGVDVGRPYNPQGHGHYPTQVEGLHYGQELSHPSTVPAEQGYVFQESTLSPAQSKSLNRVGVPVREKIACEECGATFACGANLRNHMRIHTGERPFVCEECGASFTQRSNMRSHKRVHTGERPYMCGICGQTFARSSHLPGHMRTHTGEKPFSCSHCSRSFATNQIMKNHMRTHTGERPFVCDVCDATFAQSSCLATHKKIHTGERNFKCGKCGKAFISRSGLQTHERVHTGEKPYNCKRCDKSFRTSSYLSKHKQKYCGNETFVKVNRQSDSGKTKKNSTNSHRLSKCKKSSKKVNRPLSKRTRAKRAQLPKKSMNSSCKYDNAPKPERCKLSEKDFTVTEENDQNSETCYDENGSGTGEVLETGLNSETIPPVYSQEENRTSECKLNLNWELVLARPLENVFMEQEHLNIKEEDCNDSSCIVYETTAFPQKRHVVDSEVLEVAGLHGENLSEEPEPLKQTFQDVKTLSKSQCSLSDSQTRVLQPQNQGTHHLIENYFKVISNTSFSEGAYEEEISSPPVMNVQQVSRNLPQLSSVATVSEEPQQTSTGKNESALWYSRSYM